MNNQEKANAFTINNGRVIHTFRGLKAAIAGSEDIKYVVADCGMRVKLAKVGALKIDMRVEKDRITTKTPAGTTLCTKCQRAAGWRLQQEQLGKPITIQKTKD